MKKIKCCYNCDTRHLGCHAVCEEYIRERAELDKEREAVTAESMKVNAIEGCEVARSRRARKYMGKK